MSSGTDGVKGYINNTTLTAKDEYVQYNGLWIKKSAFRVTKGTLEIRPMFNFTQRRIETHVYIYFVAYKINIELERRLKINSINLSVDKVLDITKTITTLKIELPKCRETIRKTMLIISKHKSIVPLFEKTFRVSKSGLDQQTLLRFKICLKEFVGLFIKN